MHIRRDIPEMLAGFATEHPGVAFRFGRPLGADARVADILLERAGGGVMPGLKPHEIEVRSMAIIDGLLPGGDWSPGRAHRGQAARAHQRRSVAGDGRALLGRRPSRRGAAALRAGAPVFTDTHMVRIGVNEQRVLAYGGTLECLIADEAVVEESKRTGRTRAACAMRAFGPRLDGAVVALGNAPTALREVLALAAEGVARPALVIGMPVGFVDAAESKDALMSSDLTFVAIEGTRGGSPLAAATVNALLRVAEGEM